MVMNLKRLAALLLLFFARRQSGWRYRNNLNLLILTFTGTIDHWQRICLCQGIAA